LLAVAVETHRRKCDSAVQREGARRKDFRCQPEGVHTHPRCTASKVGPGLWCKTIFTTELSDID
jgi:hypothetical protein